MLDISIENHHGREDCPSVASGLYKNLLVCVGSNRGSDDVPRTASADSSIFLRQFTELALPFGKNRYLVTYAAEHRPCAIYPQIRFFLATFLSLIFGMTIHMIPASPKFVMGKFHETNSRVSVVAWDESA